MPHAVPETCRCPCRNTNEMKIALRVVLRQTVAVQLAKHLRMPPLFRNSCAQQICQALGEVALYKPPQNVLRHGAFKEDGLLIEIRGVKLVVSQSLPARQPRVRRNMIQRRQAFRNETLREINSADHAAESFLTNMHPTINKT